uniref:ribosomal protein S13 n=1 Tax=Haslea provincialis TaxID=1764367 RepID=UPI00220BE8DC|nr:ribosomal protein S13 [Haslea provincialis]UXN44223.1 ribosomal protein S13 [Haslea provincialis]
MIYLLESKLPENKSIYFALQYIYGIGKTRAFLICKKLGFSINLKVKHLSENQTVQILSLINSLNFVLAHDLKKLKIGLTKKLVSIKSYRGLRRTRGLPVRGQRTHTNARTARRIKNKFYVY